MSRALHTSVAKRRMRWTRSPRWSLPGFIAHTMSLMESTSSSAVVAIWASDSVGADALARRWADATPRQHRDLGQPGADVVVQVGGDARAHALHLQQTPQPDAVALPSGGDHAGHAQGEEPGRSGGSEAAGGRARSARPRSTRRRCCWPSRGTCRGPGGGSCRLAWRAVARDRATRRRSPSSRYAKRTFRGAIRLSAVNGTGGARRRAAHPADARMPGRSRFGRWRRPPRRPLEAARVFFRRSSGSTITAPRMVGTTACRPRSCSSRRRWIRGPSCRRRCRRRSRRRGPRRPSATSCSSCFETEKIPLLQPIQRLPRPSSLDAGDVVVEQALRARDGGGLSVLPPIEAGRIGAGPDDAVGVDVDRVHGDAGITDRGSVVGQRVQAAWRCRARACRRGPRRSSRRRWTRGPGGSVSEERAVLESAEPAARRPIHKDPSGRPAATTTLSCGQAVGGLEDLDLAVLPAVQAVPDRAQPQRRRRGPS